MPRLSAFLVTIIVLLQTTLAWPANSQDVGESGQPIPRFVAVAASTANLRTGPGLQYPVTWVYARSGLPLKVIGERGVWRQVEDPDGDSGWMHVSLLTGDRTAMVIGSGKLRRRLYAEASSTGAVRLTVEPGVIGELIGCQRLWCAITVEGVRGYIERRHLWGVFSHEETL